VAVGTYPDDHQQAQLVQLESHLEVDPVDPGVDVVALGQGPLVERDRLVLPLAGEPGGRRGGQAGKEPRNWVSAGDKVS